MTVFLCFNMSRDLMILMRQRLTDDYEHAIIEELLDDEKDQTMTGEKCECR